MKTKTKDTKAPRLSPLQVVIAKFKPDKIDVENPLSPIESIAEENGEVDRKFTWNASKNSKSARKAFMKTRKSCFNRIYAQYLRIPVTMNLNL